jgi:hypothetical protein
MEQLSAILEGTEIEVKGLFVSAHVMESEGAKKGALPLYLSIKSRLVLSFTLRPL